jgi:hypothetical protein
MMRAKAHVFGRIEGNECVIKQLTKPRLRMHMQSMVGAVPKVDMAASQKLAVSRWKVNG